jgi:hypothetical protein
MEIEALIVEKPADLGGPPCAIGYPANLALMIVE